MRPGSYILAAIGATVMVGGVYLWLDVRGSDAAQPSDAAVAEAQARHARVRGPAAAAEVGRLRGRRDERVVAPDPALAFPTGGELPGVRADLPGTNAATFEPPNTGAVQPPIDPDDPEAASAMTETNKLYDRGDYEGARALAVKLLGKEPTNVRLLRVVVSSSCIMGDADMASTYWAQLPVPDQAQMSVRCARYQVSFGDAGLIRGRTPPTEK